MELIKVMKWVSGGIAAIALLITGCEGGTNSDGGAVGSNGGSSSIGIAGSTARMIIVDNYLYAIAENKIQLFDISIPSMPSPLARIPVDWNIQTLYRYENYLLVGAADGVHILDNTDPASPHKVGDFTHATAIDPVVASGGYAYVTLKSDPQAFESVDDQMSVISLADPRNPELKNIIFMQSPEGLSVIDNRLFVCDGVAGIKQYDLSDPVNPLLVDTVTGVDCNDVIANDNILYAITDNSLQQFDMTVSPPALLSIIETDEMSPDALTDLLGLGMLNSDTNFSEM